MSQKLAFTCAPPFFPCVCYLLCLLPGASDAALNEGQHLHSSHQVWKRCHDKLPFCTAWNKMKYVHV